MQAWLTEQILSSFSLREETEGYLLRRGARENSYQRLQVKTWGEPETPAPCKDFRKRYGEYGGALRGCLVTPFCSPSGKVVGFEARRTDPKWLSDYRIMPDSRWMPIWLGTQGATEKLWAGGAAWIVEGLFDLFAMEWVVPEGDVVLSSVRAALSFPHVQYLRRFAKYVHMVYDEDSAGRAGSAKALKLLGQAGVPCRTVRFWGGKDPGELWDHGGEERLRTVFHALL